MKKLKNIITAICVSICTLLGFNSCHYYYTHKDTAGGKLVYGQTANTIKEYIKCFDFA